MTARLTIAPYLAKNPPYDPMKAFAPISLAGISSLTPVGRTGLAPRSYAELVALARAKPGESSFALTGKADAPSINGRTFCFLSPFAQTAI